MKTWLLPAFLFVSPLAWAADHYAFVTDFELVSVQQQGPYIRVELTHAPVVEGRAKFQLVPGKFCLETSPPQCSATIVRLDNSVGNELGDREIDTLMIDPANYFDVSGGAVEVQIHGPNGHQSVRWTAEDVSNSRKPQSPQP